MKLSALVLICAAATNSAFAADRLCEAAALKQLDRYYKGNVFGPVEYTDATVADYFAGKNMAGNDIVQYQYNVETKQKNARYARITLTRHCSLVGADAYESKEAMDADDRDAAQLGAEGE
jgi:hypothetical protein